MDPLNMIYLKPILLSFLLNICNSLSAPWQAAAMEQPFSNHNLIWVNVICPPDILQQRFFSLICLLNYIDALYKKRSLYTTEK